MGNIYIAIGGLLPGIGGTFTRMGYVEMLFITELIGLLFIYIGYKIIKTEKRNRVNTKTV
jgi:xanthosine utilization system XapX-like protein